MSRVAGALASLILLAAPAAAADARLDAVGGKCRGPRVEVARYHEQICQRGAAGYSECRWVAREHEVQVPADCESRFTAERAFPAKRGAFPPGG